MTSPLGLLAKGDIYPSRFIKHGTSVPFSALQAGANAIIAGVSHESAKDPPISGASTLCAADGDSLPYYGPGEVCLVECGGNVAIGAEVEADSNGKAVAAVTTAATVRQIGGRALEDGASGKLIKILVWPYTKTNPA
jgi:hypothetical protein